MLASLLFNRNEQWLLIPRHGLGSGLKECTSSVRPSVCPSVTVRVRAITYIYIDGLPSNLVQMVSSLRRCAYIQEYLGYQSNNLYFLFSHS